MGSNTKQTTTRTPYNKAAVDSANAALSSGYGQAQGTIAQWSPALNNAISHINDNIAHPPQYLTDARGQLDKTINGDYVNSNPYTGGLADLIAGRTQGNYNATFGASGRTHGGLAALLSGQGVGDALGSFYSGVYDQERGRQQQAIMAAPGFHQDEYTDINALFPAVNNTAMLPLNAANAYGQGVTTVNAPYTTDKTVTKQGFGLGQALGLAAMIGSSFIPGGGAAMGGLSGLMGAAGGGGGSAFSGPINVPSFPGIRYLG